LNLNKNGFAPIAIIILAILVLGGAWFGYLIVYQKSSQPITNSVQIFPTATPSPTNEMANWKTFKSKIQGWEIKYPPEWIAAEEGRAGQMFGLYSNSEGGPKYEEFSIGLRFDFDITKAQTAYFPFLKSSDVAGYPGLQGERFDPEECGLVAYAQVGKDAHEFRRKKSGSEICKHPDKERKLFNAILSTAKLVPLKSDAAIEAKLIQTSPKARDTERGKNINTLRIGLEFYFDLENGYPSKLSDMIEVKILPKLPDDPLPKRAYHYSASPDKKGYHLGIGLETTDHDMLKGDADFNSLSAGWNSGFNGRDGFPCATGDIGVSCYDVKVQ